MACVLQLLLSFVLVATVLSARNNVSGIYSFGDSILDVGNNNYILAAPTSKCNNPPYGRIFDTMLPTGRFCDGELITDMIAKNMKLPFGVPYLDPKTTGEVLKQGINYASGGSGLLESTSRIQNVIGLDEQINLFKDYRGKLVEVAGCTVANDIIARGIFFVSFGSNDYGLKNLNPEEFLTDPVTFQSRLISRYTYFLKQVRSIGAKTFVILGLQPLGCIPTIITSANPVTRECVDSLNQLSMRFNANLQKALLNLEQELPGIELIYLDIYSVVQDIIQNPGNYGVTHTNIGCCGTGLIEFGQSCNTAVGACENGSMYIYFDAAHLTESTNKITTSKLMKLLL